MTEVRLPLDQLAEEIDKRLSTAEQKPATRGPLRTFAPARVPASYYYGSAVVCPVAVRGARKGAKRMAVVTDDTLWKLVAATAAAAGTVIGALIAYAGVKAANALKRLEQENKNRELVKSSLEFLTGSTQKRTVGIALLKDRVADGMISKDTAVIILQGQAEHLRDVNNANRNRGIEKHNLKIIEALISDWTKK